MPEDLIRTRSALMSQLSAGEFSSYLDFRAYNELSIEEEIEYLRGFIQDKEDDK